MCSLCGILGGDNHWADTSSNPDSFGNRAKQVTWHRERQERTRLINRIVGRYGLTVSDWSGNAFVVRSHTGKSVIAENLSQIWEAAEKINGSPCDPLEPELIRSLSDTGEPQ
ncbi:MAG: hypothetical protein AB3N20_17970 [Rhizobiaceae bacterium]